MDTRILDYLEGMYSRKLSDKEVLVLDDMLSNETLESFKNKYEFVLAKKAFIPSLMYARYPILFLSFLGVS